MPLTLERMCHYLILWDKFRPISRPKTCRGASLTQLRFPEYLVVHILFIFSVRKGVTDSCFIVNCSSLKAKLERAIYKTFGTVSVQRKTCCGLGQDPFCRDQQKTLTELRNSSTYSLLKGHLIFVHYLLQQLGKNCTVQRFAGNKAITIIYENNNRILFNLSNAIRNLLACPIKYTQEYSTMPSLTRKHSSLGSVMSYFHPYRIFSTSLTLALLLGSLPLITSFICLTALLEAGVTFISLPITRNI